MPTGRDFDWFVMRFKFKTAVTLILLILAVAQVTQAFGKTNMSIRVPAEWEEQEAIWIQWPGRYEKSYEPAFAAMSKIILQYEKLHILVSSPKIENEARAALAEVGVEQNHYNLHWHHITNDNAWMRDNGPVYVIDDNRMRVQNWEFDAWGGAFGRDVSYRKDNRVPDHVAEYLGLPVDPVDIVHERGNLEFNGKDTVILNWSTIGDEERNPGYSKSAAERDLKQLFGVSKVVFVEGIIEGDLTRGHIDGLARFINTDTVVVPDCTSDSDCQPGDASDAVYDGIARTIESAGFRVIRDPILGSVSYRGSKFDANYMNWLVGNGFVITVGFGDEELDQAARSRLQDYFPGRDIYVVEMLQSWYAGGGVHCHTNDQPSFKLLDPE